MYSEAMTTEPEKHSGSLFNQKYFEGYRRAITMDESGKMRVEFVYEGLYYTREPSESRLHRLMFALVPVLCLAGLIWTMTAHIPMNSSRGVLFFQVLLLFMLGLNLVCGAVRCLAGKELTRWEYRMAIVSVREISLVAGLAAFGLFVTAIVRGVMGQESFQQQLRGIIVYLVIAVSQFLLLTAASREKYTASESRDILNGIDVTDELTPGSNADAEYWR